MVSNEKIRFQQVKWSPEVAANLAKATAPDEAIIADEVIQGISQCWHIKNYGYLVTRLEVEPEKKILVIVAGQGQGLKDIVPLYEVIAKANQASLVRFHSRRAGMVKMVEPFNYQVEYGFNENIFYKKV